VQLVSKISNLCDHQSPTSQTNRQTDRRHAIARPRFALVGAYARVPAFSWVYCQPASHSSSTHQKSWELTSQPKRQYQADEKLTLTLSTTWMQGYLGTIVCKFGGDPVICLREEAIFVTHKSK